MALIRFGSVIQAASGRLGGICFSRQGGTPIVRTQPLQRAHDSAAAVTTRAVWARAHRLWLKLSDADLLSWQNAARQLPSPNRLGLSRQISAYNAYMASAVPALLAGDTPVPTAAASAALVQPGNLVVEIWPGGPANVTHPDGTFLNFFTLVTKAQRCVRTNPSLPGQFWKIVSRRQPGFISTNIWPELIAAFGTPVALEWYRFLFLRRVPGWPKTHTTHVHAQIPNVGPELVINGDFQIGGSPPYSWRVIGPVTLEQDTFLPWGDGISAHADHGAAQATARFLTWTPGLFSLQAAQSYTCRFAYRFDSGHVDYIVIEGSGMSAVTLARDFFSADIDWHQASYTWLQATNATNCYLNFYSMLGSSMHITVDNVSIRKDTP
jgi:hypothetical protein